MPQRNTVQIIINAQDEASDILKNVAGSVQSIGEAALKITGAALAGATAAVTGFAAASLSAFSDFQTGINEVFTLLPGITDEAMSQMEYSVQRFMNVTGRASEETIPALYQALSAGVPPDNVFAFLEVANKAALGGATDLETAVNGITSAVNAYGEETLNAAQASDYMFTAVRLGKTTFEELSASMFQVTTVAAGMDVGFGDVLAAVATLTSQGVPTSVAMTQIRQALLEINDPATEIGKKFQELAGVSLPEFIAQGNSLGDVFALLEAEAARAGIPIEQMFGSVEAGQAALALTGVNMETFTNNITEMGNAAGATDTAFNTMNQGIGLAMNKLGARWESLLVSMGRIIEPFITPLVNIFSTLIAIFGDVLAGGDPLTDWISELPTFLQPLGILVANIASGFLFFADAISNLIAAIQNGVNPLDAFQFLMYQLGGADLAFAFADMVYWIGEIGRVAGEILSPIMEWLGANIQLSDVLIALGFAMSTVVIPAVIGFFAAFAPLIGLIAAVALLRTAWEENWGGIQEKTAAVIEWVTTTGWPALQGFFQQIADAWNNTVWPGLQSFWDWFMVTGLPAIMDFITNEITPRWELFVSIMGALWENVSGAFISFYNWFMTDGLPAIMDFIDNEITPRWDAFVAVLSGLWAVVSPPFIQFFDWVMTTGLKAVMDFIDNEVVPRWQTFQDVLAGIWDVVGPAFQAFGDGVIAVLSEIAGSFLDAQTAFNNLVNTVTGSTLGGETTGNPNVNWGMTPSVSTGTVGGSGNFGGRQFGGSAFGGVPTWVGEQGRELFIPPSDGQIMNNRDSELAAAGGKPTIQVTMIIQGDVSDSQARESAYKLKRELTAQGFQVEG